MKSNLCEKPVSRFVSFAVASGVLIFASPFPKLSSLIVVAVGLIFLGRKVSGWRTLLCAAILLGFLVFSSVSGLRSLEASSVYPANYYSQLTGNLLKGKLYLPWEPDKKLLALKDPYDPAQRNNISFSWDCSLYKGKYYLYWGLAPALTFVAPFYFLSSHYPLEVTIAFWFAVWGALLSALLFIKLLESAQNRPATGFQKYMGALLVVFSLPYGALLRRPHIYEQALLSGHAYAMASLLCFTVFSERKRFSRENIFGNLAAGFLYGLALMSRPTYALLFPAFLLISFFTNAVKPQKQFQYFLFSACPLLVVILAYNYFRFENPFEFGFFYQLNHIQMSKWGFSLKDTAFAVSGFLFQWPRFSSEFPYANFQRFGEGWLSYGHRYMNDEVIGLFFAAPFAFFLGWDRKRIFENRSMRIPCLLIGLAFLLMLVSATAGVNLRYEIEFLPFFVLPAAVWALFEWERTRSTLKRVILAVLFLYTIQAGFFSSFSLELKPFAEASPRFWWQMQDAFSAGDPGNPSTHLSIEYLLQGTACADPRFGPNEWFLHFPQRSQ